MNRSRVKWLILIFLLFFSCCTTLFFPLVQSCVLLGPADGREWAIKKLVGVWPPQTSRTQRFFATNQGSCGDSNGMRLPNSYSC
jgi:hypothetical protein